MKNTKLLEELEGYINKFRSEETKVSNTLKDKYGEVFTYGSTPEETFLKLINNLTVKPKRFIVVGCSIGWVNFYWNELHPNIKTIGIDIHPYRIDFGNSLIEEYNLTNIKLSNTSFYDFEFKEGDLIWESNLCFPQTDVYTANNNILDKDPNLSIISYRPISKKDNHKINITSHYYPTSWMGRQPFWIYEKIK